jgi:hypothetical protein
MFLFNHHPDQNERCVDRVVHSIAMNSNARATRSGKTMRLARLRPKNRTGLPSIRLRASTFLGAAAVLALSVTLSLPVGAADEGRWIASSEQPPDNARLDLQLTLRAREAILADDSLAAHNLGVSVRGRQAILWGSAPCLEVARVAEERVRRVPGVTEVRNELHILPRPEHQLTKDGKFLPALRTPLADLFKPTPKPAQESVVQRPKDVEMPVIPPFSWRPVEHKEAHSSSDPRAAANPNSTTSRPGTQNRSTPTAFVRDSAPVQPLKQGNGVQPMGRAILEQPGKSRSVDKVIESLTAKDLRFRHIHWAFRNNSIHLQGKVERWEHVFELARSISRHTGIEEIVFKEVHVEAEP